MRRDWETRADIEQLFSIQTTYLSICEPPVDIPELASIFRFFKILAFSKFIRGHRSKRTLSSSQTTGEVNNNYTNIYITKRDVSI